MDDLTAEMHDSAEFKRVRDFIAGGQTLTDENFNKGDMPFAKASFTRFCNIMISAHRDNIVRREDGVTVTGEGVEVRTQRIEAGKMVYTAAPAPAITS